MRKGKNLEGGGGFKPPSPPHRIWIKKDVSTTISIDLFRSTLQTKYMHIIYDLCVLLNFVFKLSLCRNCTKLLHNSMHQQDVREAYA